MKKLMGIALTAAALATAPLQVSAAPGGGMGAMTLGGSVGSTVGLAVGAGIAVGAAAAASNATGATGTAN